MEINTINSNIQAVTEMWLLFLVYYIILLAREFDTLVYNK